MRTNNFPGRPIGSYLLFLLAGSLALPLVVGPPAQAAPGDLDPTFGIGGKVTTDFAGKSDVGFAVALQPDGKIVVAGDAVIGSNFDFALARYHPDGSLDTTFGIGGKVTTDFAGDSDAAHAVALQPDGKIVAAGGAFIGSSSDFALARYNPDGSLDATFGAGGKVTTDFAGSFDEAFAVALQPNGKIVAAGGAFIGSSSDFALARYNSDGSLDPTFGAGGKVITDFAGSFDEARAVALQPDAKIVAAGFAIIGSVSDFALVRYNPDGSLDPGFDSDGKTITGFVAGGNVARAVALQRDGKIVAAGSAVVGSSRDFALARYNQDGSLDTTFDADGKVTTDFAGSTDSAAGVAIQANGKIVAAGSAFIGSSFDFALARYRRFGRLDPSFSTDGSVTTDFAGSSDGLTALVIQPDGRIVAAGDTFIGSTPDFALARYVVE